MLDSQVLAFTLAAAALTVAPGPDTMLVLRNVLRGGPRAGVITTFGICSGLFVHATLSALGVSLLLTRSATAFSMFKLAGACYLAWLGLQTIRRSMHASYAEQPGKSTAPIARGSARRYFVEGVLSNVLNPKTAAFYLAFLPQFIRPGDPVLQRSMLFASIHFAEATSWLVALSLLIHSIQRVVLAPTVRRWLDRTCGALLIGFGVRLAFERR